MEKESRDERGVCQMGANALTTPHSYLSQQATEGGELST